MKLTLTLLLASLSLAQPLCTVKDRTGPAIQRAIDECEAKGGGTAYVPPGEYVTGPLWLKSNVELYIEAGATVALSQDQADWPTGSRALINAKGARNIGLRGRGTIDGRARYEYDNVRRQDIEIAEEQEIARKAGVEMKRYYRAGIQKELVLLRDSREVRIEGVRLVNAPIWTLHLQDCDQVWIRGIYLFTDLVKGVNGDGIDIVSSSNVAISDSTIITGDDAICVKTYRWEGDQEKEAKPARAAENITVSNCILSSSSTPMVIGTETHADVRHVVFSNIVVRDSNRVFGINVQDGATVSDVRFENVTFELNRRHWNWWGSAEVFKFVLKKRMPESRLGRIENVVIRGAQGTARGTSTITGHADRPLRNIAVEDLHVRMLPEDRPDKRATHAIAIERVDGLTLRNVEVEWDEESPEPGWGSALVLRDVTGLTLRDFQGKAGSRMPAAPAIRMERVRYKEVSQP